VGTGFHPELTGRENIFLNGTILGMRREEIRRKFDEIVAFAEVDKFLDTPVKRYSSGMYVRLAFAVAAHLEPEILIVDEVLAVGDAEFQNKCLGKMGEVARGGRTVLFVSHNMVAVKNLCKRGVLLSAGKIAAYGTIEDAVSCYMVPPSSSECDLRIRTDRAGNQLASLIGFRLTTPGGDHADSVAMGSGVAVHLRCSVKQRLERPVFGVFFQDDFGKTILRAYSHESVKYRAVQEGTIDVTCTFPKLPLMHGRYVISIWLGRPGECLDNVENVSTLTVVASDVYYTGVLPDSNNGGWCYAPHSWSIDQERPELNRPEFAGDSII
jgi:lipopolysaccharide transport system ATP-binding protein